MNDEPRVSLFPSFFSSKANRKLPGIVSKGSLTITELVDGIKLGRWENEVNLARTAMVQFGRNSKEHIDAKLDIPAVTLSVECRNRIQIEPDCHKLIDYNFILQIDTDFHCGIDELNHWKDRLSQDPYILFVALSPSGDGLKAALFYSIPDDIELNYENLRTVHESVFQAVDEYLYKTYEIRNDKAVKDPYRLCFLTYDPDIRVNEEVQALKLDFSSKPMEESHYEPIEFSDRKAAAFIRIACSKVRMSKPGSIHNTLYKQSCVLGSFVKQGWLDDYEATNLLIKAITANVHTTADYDSEHKRVIADGIARGKTF